MVYLNKYCEHDTESSHKIVKMADDSGNEEQWLYGDSNQEPPEDENKEKHKGDTIDTTAEDTQQSENTGESGQVFSCA